MAKAKPEILTLGEVRNYLVSSPLGGVVEVYEPDTGEIVANCVVPPGQRSLRAIVNGHADHMGINLHDVFPIGEPASCRPMKHPGAYRSGANPDFTPSRADTMQRQMRGMMRELRREQRKLLQRDVKAGKPDDMTDVIDVVDDASPDAVAAAKADAEAKAKADAGSKAKADADAKAKADAAE